MNLVINKLTIKMIHYKYFKAHSLLIPEKCKRYTRKKKENILKEQKFEKLFSLKILIVTYYYNINVTESN